MKQWRIVFILGLITFHTIIGTFTAKAGVNGGGAPDQFMNPVAKHGQDPWVVNWQTNYLYCQSRTDGIWVNRTARLEDIGQDHWQRVWQAPKDTAYSKQVWAPELHFLQGKWYIYFAADDGDNANHRMYVLEGSSVNPQSPFGFKGKITAPTDRWAIDGTVLEMPDGKLHFIWSGWEGAKDGEQELFIARMSNPWTISGERVRISRPEHPWERKEFPHINEGPETLWHDGKLFIIYSASGFWGNNYCLGQLTWKGGDPLNELSWEKNPDPVFQSTADVFGPGHCSFVKSPDGREDWMVYHAHIRDGTSERDVRIQKFTWNLDGSPNFGVPASPRTLLNAPSGE